jgi:hypothetical protein
MRKVFFLFVFMAFFISQAITQVVHLYEDCYYGGRSVSLRPGNYLGFQHNLRVRQLSSIDIPPGFTVNLFSRDYFTGQYISLNSTTPCLVDQQFNDMMVSIQVIDDRQNQSVNAPVTVFYRCNFQGPSQLLYEGNYNQLPGGFNNIQSIVVSPGYGVIFKKELKIGNVVSVTNEEYRSDKTCLSLFWGSSVSGAYIYKLDNVYDDYWNSTPTHIANFNNGAVAYSDVNYRGRGQMLNPGAYRSYQLDQVGYHNISSIKISSGYEVILFSGNDFNGSSILLSASQINLHAMNGNWGNRAGSLIVQRARQPIQTQPSKPVFIPNPSPSVNNPAPARPQPNTNSGDFVIAYMDANYRGPNIALPVGTYRSHELPGVGPRTISSIKIPPGFKVTVYDGIALDGDWRVLTYSIDNFVTEGRGLWNDRISSLVVERIQNASPR